MQIDIEPILRAARAAVGACNLGSAGLYRRWVDPARDAALNPYGVADAANILYTLGQFPSARAERQGWIDTLRGMQRVETGLYDEATHHTYHVTAHCIAALELFDARPAHRLSGLDELKSPAALHRFLDDLEWTGRPWRASHRGAGIYAALVLAGEVDSAWETAYFDWLWEEADEQTGFWRRGRMDAEGSAPLFHHLAGSFHYLFNHQYARRPLRYPERMIDTCLHIGRERLWPTLGRAIGFAEIDWVYCITRSLRQCGHRFADCQAALRTFADDYVGYLRQRVETEPRPFDDLHTLFGMLCALAELQSALPGELPGRRPLRLVLDRRPFI